MLHRQRWVFMEVGRLSGPTLERIWDTDGTEGNQKYAGQATILSAPDRRPSHREGACLGPSFPNARREYLVHKCIAVGSTI